MSTFGHRSLPYLRATISWDLWTAAIPSRASFSLIYKNLNIELDFLVVWEISSRWGNNVPFTLRFVNSGYSFSRLLFSHLVPGDEQSRTTPSRAEQVGRKQDTGCLVADGRIWISNFKLIFLSNDASNSI